MRNKILVLLSLVVFGFGTVTAQEKLQLTLSQAQELALAHNREVQNASLDIRIAQAARWQTIATMLPQVSASLDYNSLFGYRIDFGGQSILMANSGTFTGTAAIAFSGAQVVAVQMQNIAAEMADITKKQTEQTVLNQVKLLYFSALVTEETVSLLEKNLQNLEKMKTYTESAVVVGISEQTDADRIAVQVASMKNGVNSARRSLEMVYNSIRLTLGTDVNTEIELVQGVEELLSVDDAVALLDTEFMLGNNYNYQLLEVSTKLSEKQVALKKWAFAPSLTTYYSFTKKKIFSDEFSFDMTPPNALGVSLSIPIFSSWSRMKAVDEARLNLEKQRNTLDATREALIIQHKQLAFNLTSNFENYETQKENLVVVQRVFDNVTKKYEQGMASSLDLTSSGTELVTAQSTYVQALLNLVTAQIELENLLNNRK